jgi:hypothetical protein
MIYYKHISEDDANAQKIVAARPNKQQIQQHLQYLQLLKQRQMQETKQQLKQTKQQNQQQQQIKQQGFYFGNISPKVDRPKRKTSKAPKKPQRFVRMSHARE